MKIYRDGIEIYEVKDYKQNGRFMEIATIDCTIKSPTPLVFKVGDYVVSEHNGIKFSIYEIYPEKKQARKDTYGEAFIYDLKFKSNTEELNICPFLDLVPNDNNIVYTSLPSWSTYENVYGIVARIQANMDYLYPNRWLIRVADTTDVELLDTLNEAREFTISGESCFEGLKKIHDNWAVGYIHTYEDGKDVITIGKSAGTTSLFRYGKGQGLKTIKKNIQNTDQFCTRALVFGSTRNMPARWYNTKGYINESQYIPNLMIPPTKWVGGVPQGAYIDAIFGEDNRIEKYGLKIKTLSYDGSDSTKDEIFPSVEKVTAKNIRDAKAEISDTEYIPSPDFYPDNERMDQVLIGSNITDSGIKADEGYKLYSDYVWYHIDAFSKTITIAEVEEDEKERYNVLYPHLTLELATYNITKPANYRLSENPDIITLKKNDRHSAITAGLYLKKPSGDYIKLSEITFKEELESDLPISNALGDSLLVALDTVGIYSLEARIDVNWSEDAYHEVYPESGEGINLDLIVNVNNAYTTLSRGENIVSKYFDIKIKQIGFDINDVTASSGSPKRIHFKSGMCAGRSFDIRKASYNEEDDSWILSCRKIEDSSTSLMYPNNIFQIQQGDQFVLLNIVMPDLYIYTAMQRLYDTAYSDLQYLSNPQYVIEPEIDNLQIARSPQTLAEGMYMPIEDGDLNFNDEVLIDSVVVTYKDKELPRYEVTLRNGKIFNRFSKIASRISELENAVKQSEASSAISNVESDNKTESLSNSGNSQQIENNRKAIETIKSEVGVLRDMWVLDPANGAVRTRYNLIVEGGGAFGKGQESEDTPSEANIAIKIDGRDILYKPIDGVITIPAYPENTGLDESELEKYLTTNQYAKKSDIPSLSGYATEQWVNQQGFLTQHQDLSAYAKSEDIANTYATKSALKGVSDSVDTLRGDFDNLNTLLNGNVGGVIDTWNEVVSFLDGYSQSDDLATILSGMNSDIANRVLIEDFEKLEGSVTEIAGYFTNGSANNALKLGGQLPSYYATANALNTHITAFNTYKTTTDNRLNKLEDYWFIDANGNLRTTHNIVVEGGGAFGMGAESGGSTGGLGSVTIKTERGIEYKSDASGVVTVPNWITASALNGYATESYVTTRGYITGITSAMVTNALGYTPYNSTNFTKATIKSTLGIADWALAATKPSYAFSEITSKPTTLAGYGITDATHYFKGDGYARSKVANGSIVQYGDGAEWRLTDNLWSIEYVILHHLNYSNYALPKSGGTISGALAVTGNLYTPNIWFNAGDNGERILAPYSSLNYDLSYYDGSTWERVLTSKNYSSYALPLIGGTIKGTAEGYTQHIIKINTDNTILSDIQVQMGGVVKAGVGYSNNSTISGYRIGAFLFNATAASSIGVKDNGTPYYNNNTLIHSGNIGSQSVNYASSAYWTSRFSSKRNTGFDANSNEYLLVSDYGSGNPIYNKPDGFIYGSIFTPLPSDGGTSLLGQFAWDINHNTSTPTKGLWFRASNNLGWGNDWKTIAFTDSNVASATKLQDDTAFTAWGQIFFNDGKPVSLSGKLTSVSYLRFYDANATSPGIYGGTHYSASLTANDLVIYAAGGKIILDNGNVLIGTTTDNGAKLQVGGTTHITITPTSNVDINFLTLKYNASWSGYPNALGGISITDNSNGIVGKFGITYSGGVGRFVVKGLFNGSYDGSGEVLKVDAFGDASIGRNLNVKGTSEAKSFYAKGLYTYGSSWNSGAGGLNVAVPNDSGQTPLVVGYRTGTSPATAGVDRLFALELLDDGTQLRYSWGSVAKHIFYNNGNTQFLGNLTVSGGGAFGSDIRYKAILSYLQLDLETIANAPLFTFKWNDREDKATHLGTSAQYWLETQAKDAVNTTNKDFFHLDYGALAVGMGISVGREVKVVKTEVEQLRKEVKDLKTRLSKYEQVWHN